MSIKANLDTYIRSNLEPNHRFNSWNHCFDFFQQKFLQSEVSEEEKDHLALHLAFYLASWGMYRGSAQILQKDYKIFLPITDILLDKGNSLINCLPYSGVLSDSNINKTLTLSGAIKRALNAQFGRNSRPPSHTLISKILLGTLCCVPALDNYFVSGFRKFRTDNTSWGNSALNSNTLMLINQVFNANIQEFASFQNREYPDAKLIDMAFWQQGMDNQ